MAQKSDISKAHSYYWIEFNCIQTLSLTLISEYFLRPLVMLSWTSGLLKLQDTIDIKRATLRSFIQAANEDVDLSQIFVVAFRAGFIVYISV